jgi:hypothetical protein
MENLILSSTFNDTYLKTLLEKRNREAEKTQRDSERHKLTLNKIWRQRDSETEGMTDKETERQRDRETERQRDRETKRQKDRKNIKKEQQKDRERDKVIV